jgi:D-3-phosphoglycerate dehydrogenase / 2-oxoglutarate reductase
MTHERTQPATALTVWSERPVPAEMLHLLAPARALGAWAGDGGDPLWGIEQADGIIASSRIRYDAATMRLAPRLRVIARTGTGVDNVDVEAATRRGIAVCNVPDGPTVSTAEHAIALLFAVSKRLKATETSVEQGRWDIFNERDAVELAEATLGIVGLGKIGRRVASIARAIGMDVVAWDPQVDPGVFEALGVRAAASLDELMSTSHAVSVHVPLTDATRGFIDRRRIALMRPGAMLVNTARGGIVDEEALLDALDAGRLSGVGFDVFAHEPLPGDSRFLRRDDVVLTPHVAAATVAGRDRLWISAIDDTMRCLRGEPPLHAVNAEALERARTSRMAVEAS